MDIDAELTRRAADEAHQKAEEDAARERLGLEEGKELGTLFLDRKEWKQCQVSALGQYTVLLRATRGPVRRCWNTTARLIEQAMK